MPNGSRFVCVAHVVAALFLAACATKKNPAKCNDDVCIDADRPYCDSDGLIGGTPNTCIPADCEPLAFGACRGDVAITCNADSTNYDETACPLGCDEAAGGCRQCTDNTQCSSATPICDATTSQCRTCIVDDECDSRVCDFTAGTCAPETSVVYASPSGGAIGCSKTQPCALQTAFTAALGSAHRVLRLLPGVYDTPIKLDFANSNVLEVVGTGATIAAIGDTPAITVVNGGNMKIRGLGSTSERHVLCGQAGTTSRLSIDDAVFTSIGNLGRLEVRQCQLKVTRSDLKLNGPSAMYDDADVELDRVHVSGNGNNLNIGFAARVRLTITNSLLENVYVNTPFLQDTGPPGTRIVLAYDTFANKLPIETCEGETYPFRTVLFENSIVTNTGQLDAIEAPNAQNCTFVSTITFPQTATAPVNAINMDPQFVDPVNRDFHLKSSSPAIDAATAGTIVPGPDLEGHSRPLGAKPDLGAYERTP